MTSNIDYLEFKFKLRELITNDDISKVILKKIKEIPNYETLKLDVELTLFLCNLCENIIADKGLKKFDKKAFVINLIKELFSELSEEEIALFDGQIEFLWNNNRIKRVSFYRIWTYYICNFFSTKSKQT
jgi:hypothetical protein